MKEDSIKGRQSTFFRQLFFLAVIIAIGFIIFKQLQFLIGSFLGAITIYVVLRNTQFKLTEKHNWKPWIASLSLTLMTSVLLLAIGFLIFNTIAAEISGFNPTQFYEKLRTFPEKINQILGFTAADQIIPEANKYLNQAATGIFNSAYSFIINVFLMLIVLYFMLTHGRDMEKKAFDYIPFWGKSLDMIKFEVKNMIYSNAIGIPLIMLGQGLSAGLLYWSLGIEDVLFWAFLTALAGLIPMIGTAIIFTPLSIWLISNGAIWQGITLMILGLLIVANVDNLIRIVLMKKVANTPPLIVIFGVILGIPLFGFWGIIFGPLLISGFLLLIKIYYAEYRLIDTETTGNKPQKNALTDPKNARNPLKN